MEKKLSLWSLSWPIMIEMFLQFAIGTADTLMVSRISDDAVAVVGFSNQFLTRCLLCSCLSRAVREFLFPNGSAGLRAEARTIGTMAIVLTGALGAVVSVVLLFGTESFAAALQMPEEIRPLGHTYMSIVGGGMVFTALNAALSTCVRNTGDTRSPMYIAFAMNILHIVLNALFIFGALGFPKWGLFGVALSTLFVRVLAVLLLLRLFRHAFETPIAWREFGKFDFRLLKEVFKIGWPMSVNGASWQVSQLAITSLIGVMGAQALAARTYMNTMESFAFTIGWSLAMAVQIQIAHEYGAGRYREAYYSCYRVLGIGLVLVLVNTGLILSFRESILNFFTADPWIVDMAVSLLWLNLLLQPGKCSTWLSDNRLTRSATAGTA